MGFWDKLKGKKKIEDWSKAYTATPKFYEKPDESPFGAIAVTEGVMTILPKFPQDKYRVDGKKVTNWKMVLISITKDTVIGDTNYFTALKKAERYVLEEKEESLLLKGLSVEELEDLKG